VVSEEQSEVEKFRRWDLDITLHRRLIKEGIDLPGSMRSKPQFRNMQRMELDEAFKLEEHPFSIAIVCANRVNEGKNNGLIVDYCGILKHLRKALGTFAGTQAGGQGGETNPARPDEELLADLAEANAFVRMFLDERSASLDDVIYKKGFERNAAIVADYNREKDRITIEQTFKSLLRLVQKLDEEDSRAVREGLDEESLAIFDLLKKQDLSASDIKRIKAVAVGLLGELKAEKLRVDQWRDKEATRDAVRVTIRNFLWSDKTGLSVESYTPDDVNTISDEVFRHVYRVYPTVPSPCYAEAA
jgi:type I site-specific restriction-modification system R (restriction) subunit